MSRYSVLLTLLLGFAILNTGFAGINYYSPSTISTIEHAISSLPGGSVYGAGIQVIGEHAPVLSSSSWIIAGALVVWRGRVRANWMKVGFDRDVFELFVIRRGAGTRLRILATLSTPKDRLQVAQDLSLSWRVIDRHLAILSRYGLVNVQTAYGRVRMYSTTRMGQRLMELAGSLQASSNGLMRQEPKLTL